MNNHIPLHAMKEKQTLIDLVNASLRTCPLHLPQDAKTSFLLQWCPCLLVSLWSCGILHLEHLLPTCENLFWYVVTKSCT